MPITGPPPNPNSRRRNADTFADVTPAEGTPAPDMTEVLRRVRPASREWWPRSWGVYEEWIKVQR